MSSYGYISDLIDVHALQYSPFMVYLHLLFGTFYNPDNKSQIVKVAKLFYVINEINIRNGNKILTLLVLPDHLISSTFIHKNFSLYTAKELNPKAIVTAIRLEAKHKEALDIIRVTMLNNMLNAIENT